MSHANNQAEQIKNISGVNPLKCMKCGKCSATCPAFNEMDIKPHQFVSYVQNGDLFHNITAPIITTIHISACTNLLIFLFITDTSVQKIVPP